MKRLYYFYWFWHTWFLFMEQSNGRRWEWTEGSSCKPRELRLFHQMPSYCCQDRGFQSLKFDLSSNVACLISAVPFCDCHSCIEHFWCDLSSVQYVGPGYTIMVVPFIHSTKDVCLNSASLCYSITWTFSIHPLCPNISLDILWIFIIPKVNYRISRCLTCLCILCVCLHTWMHTWMKKETTFQNFLSMKSCRTQ